MNKYEKVNKIQKKKGAREGCTLAPSFPQQSLKIITHGRFEKETVGSYLNRNCCAIILLVKPAGG